MAAVVQIKSPAAAQRFLEPRALIAYEARYHTRAQPGLRAAYPAATLPDAAHIRARSVRGARVSPMLMEGFILL